MDLEQEGKKWDFRVRSFVGREQERRALDAALGRAIRFDAPQFVTVIGESGLGKTRLVQEWVKPWKETENSAFSLPAADHLPTANLRHS